MLAIRLFSGQTLAPFVVLAAFEQESGSGHSEIMRVLLTVECFKTAVACGASMVTA